ncbi:MAG TPA: tetratricopeptide repeat protein, partial [Longimicrobium sp.]|nr:tetratricopeptide repeat protein [Longimicrobium sp.]
RAGQLDASFAALKEFADASPDDTDVRLLLADQLLSHERRDEAIDQLLRLRDHLRARGDEAQAEEVQQRVLAIDPHVDLASRGGAAAPAAGPEEDFGYQDTDEPADDDAFALEFHGSIEPGLPEPDAQPLPGLELPAAAAGDGEIGGLEGLETSSWSGADEAEGHPLLDPGLEIEHTSLAPEEPAASLPGLDDLQAPDGLPGLEDAAEPEDEDAEAVGEPLPFLDLDGGGEEPDALAAPALELAGWEPAPADPLEELRERVAAAPEDGAALGRLVDLLEERGRADEAGEVLAAAHRELGARGLLSEAISAVRSLLARRPDDTALYQKQVEYAFRAGDTGSMVRAYLDLGRHLGSPQENPKSRAVYQRVLEMDPGNEEARRMLPQAPPPPAAAPADDYVDLGSLIMEDEPDEKTTRFVVEEEEPTGDEDRDFADMLAVFRQKVSENIEAEDSSSHYDLGLAFMEMGLLDEAIAEFQVALRGGANPLATLELLGRCFVEKGQSAVAVRVLERALRLPDATEAELVGVVYQLGRCQEALGNRDAAVELYERVLTVDIRFRDALSRLEGLRRSAPARGF